MKTFSLINVDITWEHSYNNNSKINKWINYNTFTQRGQQACARVPIYVYMYVQVYVLLIQ